MIKERKILVCKLARQLDKPAAAQVNSGAMNVSNIILLVNFYLIIHPR